LKPISESADAAALAATVDEQSSLRLVYGVGSLDRLGELAAELGAKRVLLVTDRGIVQAGHAERAVTSLKKSGLDVRDFDGVEENPTTKHVTQCVAAAREFSVDALVAVGGGSSMDTAKGANFILTNGGEMRDYWGVGKAKLPMLPMIAVPTTAGTGSEAQSFALIADEHTHQKMACGDKKAMCRVAVLDPAVTVSQPPMVSSIVGIDAIAHAVESFVTRKRNPLSVVYSQSAWRLLTGHFALVLKEPENLQARGAMLFGAHLAGRAIESSMLGAAHSAANPLTARHGITHGIAVGIMLPAVVRFNARLCNHWYAELIGSNDDAGEKLASRLTEFLKRARLPQRIRDCGIQESSIEMLAEEAAQQWTAHFNPRPIDAQDFAELYRQVW
jgi:alcohol dehydrogenase